MEEIALMKEIKRACSRYAIMFRINVGTGKTYDGRYFSTGVPRGFSDLFGVRRSDGKAIFIEVKTAKGRLSKNQTEFLDAVKSTGAICGVCRSVEEAITLITGKRSKPCEYEPVTCSICKYASINEDSFEGYNQDYDYICNFNEKEF